MKNSIKLTRRVKLFLWLVTVVILFATILLSIYGVFSLIVMPGRDRGTIEYRHGVGNKRDPSADVPRSAFYPDGVAYVNFTSLADACDFSVSGDENEIRYLIETEKGVYDTVTFYYGSCEAIVNGTYQQLQTPVRKQGSWVLVPATFVSTYMKGITVEVTKEQIRVIYDIDEISLVPDIKPIPPIE